MGTVAGKSAKNRKGISLIEALFSSTVLAVVITASVLLVMQNLHLNRTAKNLSAATNIAQKHLERVKKLPISSLAMAEETDTYVDENGDPVGATHARFKRSTIVTQLAGEDLVELKVQVNYKTRQVWSTDTVVELVTYVHEFSTPQ